VRLLYISVALHMCSTVAAYCVSCSRLHSEYWVCAVLHCTNILRKTVFIYMTWRLALKNRPNELSSIDMLNHINGYACTYTIVFVHICRLKRLMHGSIRASTMVSIKLDLQHHKYVQLYAHYLTLVVAKMQSN
jgi:hypothetical protein